MGPSWPLCEREVADLLAAMTHRHSLEGLRAHQVCGIAERADLAGQVVQPQRPRQVAQVFE